MRIVQNLQNSYHTGILVFIFAFAMVTEGLAQKESGNMVSKVSPAPLKPKNKGYAPVNGLQLYYEIYGTGQPLVLIHGRMGSIEMFGSNISLLSKDRQVIAVDLQGHGRTADI